MKKQAKLFVLTIAVLCLSISSALADSAPAGNTVHGNVQKEGVGTFTAEIKRPLRIHNIAPTPLFRSNIPVYVKGSEYDMKEINSYPYCQYTIRGELNTPIFVKSTSTTINDVVSMHAESGEYNSVKSDGEGVTVYMYWTVTNGIEAVWNGSSTVAHTPYNQEDASTHEVFGELIVTIYYKRVIVDQNARSGDHTFSQTIEVSYKAL